LKNFLKPTAGKTWPGLEDRTFHFLSWKHKGNEHSLTPPVFIGGKPSEAIAAIDQFFDGELQRKFDC